MNVEGFKKAFGSDPEPEYLFMGIMSCCSTGGCYSSLRSKKHPNGFILGLQMGEKTDNELACLTVRCCLGLKNCGAPIPTFPAFVHVKKDDKICQISIPCLQLGLKKPETCFSGNTNLCCLHMAADLMKSGDQVPEQVCACCTVRFKPAPERCCVPPFSSPSLSSMSRF
mmetsp:Transcript_49290/g.67077  ORF Transcript_49290/g.67077 Transcript_49290/m.67077 type:complete len:169 (+) Transcript_49290:3-509(+)